MPDVNLDIPMDPATADYEINGCVFCVAGFACAAMPFSGWWIANVWDALGF